MAPGTGSPKHLVVIIGTSNFEILESRISLKLVGNSTFGRLSIQMEVSARNAEKRTACVYAAHLSP